MASVRPPWRLLLAAVVLSAGCGDVAIRRAAGPNLFEAWKSSAIRWKHGLSPRTLQTLRRRDLEAFYNHDPGAAAAQLHAEAVKDPQPDLLFALAEMHFIRGRQLEKWSCRDAICFYYFSAGYAYHYLFATCARSESPAGELRLASGKVAAQPLSPADAFDPRFRLACDLYNTGLAKCLQAAQRVGRLDPRKALHIPLPEGDAFTLSIVHAGFPWQPEEFGPFQFCDDYQVTGLANQYHTYGLGVPLIATHGTKGPSYYPSGASFPVTAFFRFEGTVADLGTNRTGRLEVYNPLSIQAVEVRGRTVPLESDLTTPLAYFLANTDLGNEAYTGFLDPDKISDRGGIQLLEPYQPGKIPVLLVHGLLSSPTTWTPLYNDLRADPKIRERYQFWAYFYPTGNPFVLTAADLREDLDKLRVDLDPAHKDAALDRMVVVGHSMGGLVSHLLTVNSGNDFWHLVSKKPLESLELHPQTRAELKRVFFFERRKYIERVVFIGTPHHGSKLSPALPGRIAAYFVRLPKTLVAVAHDVADDNPDLPTALRAGHIPTSVDLLAPHSPALEVLAGRPNPNGLHFHSIIGVAPKSATRLERLFSSDGCEEGDGVVSYASAHLDAVESERVVTADHFHVHHHPLAVLEVRRILQEHYRTVDGQQPASAR
jgi:pimeloyl-ACP methyl ester carboxylesterase